MAERRRRLVLSSAVVCGATLLAALVLIAPIPLDEPHAWGGDTLEHAVLVDSANWLGEPGWSSETGAPHGVDWSEAPSGGERLHLAVISVLSGVTGSLWTGINLHMLLGIVATALAGFLVLRWMGVAEILAGGAAIVFALSSPVFDHIEQGHLFLFALYPVPIAVYLALRWSGWRPAHSARTEAEKGAPVWQIGRRELLVSALCVLLVALSSTYYALFGVIVIAAVALLVAIRNLDWRRAVPGVVCAASITLVMLISSLPDLLSDAPRLERKLSDSIRFALDPLLMLAPQRENLTGLTGWGASPAVAIGVAATAGVVWLGWVLLRHIGRGDGTADGLLLRLAAILATAVAVGVPGGIGWLIARMGGQELRAWSRVSVFVGFVGLASLAVLADRALARRRDSASRASLDASSAPGPESIESSGPAAPARHLLLVTVGIVLLALLEQRSMLPDRSHVRERFEEAAAVAEDMEQSLPPGSAVLVLPAGSYLNDFGPGEALALPLMGDTLRYSSGSFRGGSGDWQLSWALEPVPQQLEAASAAGFSAVVLQSDHHRLEDPTETVSEITDALGRPSGEIGSWLWWELPSADDRVDGELESAARPLGLTVSGTPGFPSTSEERDALIFEEAAVRVVSHDGDENPVLLGFEVISAEGASVELSWEDGSGRQVRELEAGPEGQSVVVELDMAAGDSELGITVSGEAIRGGGQDPDAFAELRGIRAFDAALAGFAATASGFLD